MRSVAVAAATTVPSASRNSPRVVAERSSRDMSQAFATRTVSGAGRRNSVSSFTVIDVCSGGSCASSTAEVAEFEHRRDEAALDRAVAIGEFGPRREADMDRSVGIEALDVAAEQARDRRKFGEVFLRHLPPSNSTSVVPSAAGLGETRMPAELHRLDLGLRAAFAAGDDRAGMAHAAARRRGDAGDEADHRFFDLVVLDEVGGVFLGAAADLADHDDALGLRIGEEHLQHLDMLGALDRIAADADAGRSGQGRPPWSAPPLHRSACRNARRCRPCRGDGCGPA